MTIQVEEKSLQLALVKAAGKLGVTQEALGYEVISESNGFFGLFGKKIAIKAWKKSRRHQPNRENRSPRNRESAAASNAQTLAPALSSEQIQSLKQSIETFASGLFSAIAGEDVKTTLKEDGERLIVDGNHPFLAEQINKNSRFAEALEHVIRKKPRELRQEWPFRVFVDAGGIRQAREEELVSIAKSFSDKVFENRKPIVLNYRSSYDRKIIHMALDRDVRVFTKSIGSGPNRKLMILPSKDAGQEVSV